jgi:hypothetical protein
MKNILMSFVVVALVAVVPASAAQEPKAAQNPMAARTAMHQEAMKKLEFLAGTWKGKATYWMGPDQKHEVEQTEIVQFRQQGTLLHVEGLGKDMRSGSIVHEALGVVTYDEATRKYVFMSWAGAGRSGTFEATVGPNRLEWSMKNAGGNFRYTAVLNDKGEWFEIGERSTDGATWTKFIEMTLQKVP